MQIFLIFEVHNWLTNNDVSLNVRKVKTDSMIFCTSTRVKKATPLNKQIKGTSIHQILSYKYLGTHLDSTLALNGNFNLKYQKSQFQIAIAAKTTPKSKCKSLNNDLHQHCNSSVYISWSCKSKSIEGITWKT